MTHELVCEIVLVLIGRLMLRPCLAGPYLKRIQKLLKENPQIKKAKHKITVTLEEGAVQINVKTQNWIENYQEPIESVESKDKNFILFEDDYLLNLRELFTEDMVKHIMELIDQSGNIR